jgi:hypothetical protein
MGAPITPMKNGDSYGSPFFIAVICAPIGVFCVPMLSEAPVADQEETENAGGVWSLKIERRSLQQITRLEAGLEAVSSQAAEPVLQEDTRPPQRGRIRANLQPDEAVRLDVLAGYDLGSAQE